MLAIRNVYKTFGNVDALNGLSFEVKKGDIFGLLGFETDNSEGLRKQLPKNMMHPVKNGKRVIVVNPQSHYKLRQVMLFSLLQNLNHLSSKTY